MILHSGFEFGDLPAGSTTYQMHLCCYLPPATTASAALLHVLSGFPSQVKVHTAVVRLASTAELPGLESGSLQWKPSRSVQIQRPAGHITSEHQRI